MKNGDSIKITMLANGFMVEPVFLTTEFVRLQDVYVFIEKGMSMSTKDNQNYTKETLLGFIDMHFTKDLE